MIARLWRWLWGGDLRAAMRADAKKRGRDHRMMDALQRGRDESVAAAFDLANAVTRDEMINAIWRAELSKRHTVRLIKLSRSPEWN